MVAFKESKATIPGYPDVYVFELRDLRWALSFYDARHWCTDQFGGSNDIGGEIWGPDNDRWKMHFEFGLFFFTSQTDAAAFKLCFC